MRKVAILGTNGVLGSHLLAATPEGVVVSGFGGRANVSNLISALEDESYDVLINAAGRIPETHPTASDAINANALLPLALAPVCARNDVTMFHVSTDCVYGVALASDGVPRLWRADRDVPIPSPNVYSLSKFLGEMADTIVIRTSFAHPSRGFWRDLRVAHEHSHVFTGYTKHFWSGSTAPEASAAIWRLVLGDRFPLPIYHVATAEPITKFQASAFIVAHEGLRVEVEPRFAGVVDRSLTPTTPECVMKPFAEAIALR